MVAVLPMTRASGQEFCSNAAVNDTAGDGPFSVFAADLDGDNHAGLTVAKASNDNVPVLMDNRDGTLRGTMDCLV